MNQTRLIGVGGPLFKANNKNVELFRNLLSEIPKYWSQHTGILYVLQFDKKVIIANHFHVSGLRYNIFAVLLI